MHLELRHLRYFLAVAEELNFSRAAERLHIAQPALSAQIRALETQLGCQLFVRTTRRVELTAHGQTLLEDAHEIVARADRAVAKLRSAARGERGMLRIGLLAHGAGEIGSEILRRFAEALPDVETAFVEAVTLEEIQRHLRDHDSDVAFAWLPLLYEELAAAPIRSEDLYVCMHSEHSLASRSTLTVSDLFTVPIVAEWDEAPWTLLAPWLGEVRPEGRQPGDPNAKQLAECLAIVSRGLAVYCVPDSVSRFYPRPDLAFRPVIDATPSTVAIAWSRHTKNPVVTLFVEIARTAVAAASGSGAVT